MKSVYLIGLALLCPICFACALFLPLYDISLSEAVEGLWNDSSPLHTLFFEFRLPKTITAVLVGAALSVSGLQMQAVFRNPLAGPYVLGISAGSGLGVAILMLATAGVAAYVPQWSLALAAFAGGFAVLCLIFFFSIRLSGVMSLLIVGMLIGSMASAIINLLQYFSSESALKNYTLWSMGSLGGVTWSQLQVLAVGVLVGLVLAVVTIKALNVLQMGENYARVMGISLLKSRILIFLSTGILTGCVTAFCGPIGFIGIIVPHIARLVFQTARQTTLLVASVLLGINIMLIGELLTRVAPNGMVLPINSVTAFIGIPIIITMVCKKTGYDW